MVSDTILQETKKINSVGFLKYCFKLFHETCDILISKFISKYIYMFAKKISKWINYVNT